MTARDEAILSLAAPVKGAAVRMWRRGGCRLLLEDIEQAGWLGAIRAVDTHDGRVPLRAYAGKLIAFAIHTMLRDQDHLTQWQRRAGTDTGLLGTRVCSLSDPAPAANGRASDDTELGDTIADPDATEAVTRSAEGREVRELCRRLTLQQQAAIRLLYWEGLTYAKAGRRVSVSGPAIHYHEQRALRALREAYGAAEEIGSEQEQAA